MTSSGYCAFISYRHRSPDCEIAGRLHTLIETYRIPHALRNEKKNRHPGRVFRDQEELPSSADLGKDIENALDQSEWLICICSPSYPESRWCMREIDYFLQKHDRSRVLAVLASGEPAESFPDLLCRKTDERGVTTEYEPLAADVRAETVRASLKKLNTEKLRILAPMLGTNFDGLYQRQKRRTLTRAVAAVSAAASLLSVFLVYALIQNRRIDAQRIAASRNECDLLIEKSVSYLSQHRKTEVPELALRAKSVSDSIDHYAEDRVAEILAAACYAEDFSKEATMEAGPVFALENTECFSPDGKRVLGIGDYELNCCDTDTGALIWKNRYESPVSSARWKADGSRIVITSLYDGLVRVLDARSGETLSELSLPWPDNAIYHQDLLYICDEDGLLQWDPVSDPKGENMTRCLTMPESHAASSRIAGGGKYIILHSGNETPTFGVADLQKQQTFSVQSPCQGMVNACAVSPDARKLFVHQKQNLLVFDLETKEILWERENEEAARWPDDRLEALAISSKWVDGFILNNERTDRADSEACRCSVYREENGELLYTLENETCRAVLPESGLFIGSNGIYRISSGERIAELPGQFTAVDSENRHYLLDETEKVIALGAGTQEFLPVFQGTLYADRNPEHKTVSPDGRFTVVPDIPVTVVDQANGQESQYSITGFSTGDMVVFSSDSRFLALGGDNGQAGVFDLADSGRCLYRWEDWYMKSALSGMTFSRDGRFLMIADYTESAFCVASVNQGLTLYVMHAVKPVREWGFDEETGDAVLVYEDGSALRADLFTSPDELYRFANRLEKKSGGLIE